MNTAIYLRISTDDQKFDSQEQELRSYCDRRQWAAPLVFKDTASGASVSRSGLDTLMAAVRKGKVSRIVVYKLDRLGRSLTHLALILGELDQHAVALVCTSQGIDTSNDNPVGRLQLNVLMAVAQFEREIIRERVRAGISAAKQRGTKLGRPGTLDAFRGDVQRLRAEGVGVREIGRRLNLPPSSVAKLTKPLTAVAVAVG